MTESGGRGRKRGFVLAIDGPAGSGKTTTARECARRLGFFHLDTGAMYRAMTLKALERSHKAVAGDPRWGAEKPVAGNQKSEVRITERRRHAEFRLAGPPGDELLRTTRVRVTWRGEEMRVSLDGRDVSEEVRHPRVSEFVSLVSAVPAVRRKMVAEQRRAAQGRNVVCEGRDIGSVVFPDADVKVFLDCDIKTRGARRTKELNESGVKGVRPGGVLDNLKKRDRMDSTRRVAPLRRMKDAALVDTSSLTIEEQVDVVCALVRRRQAEKKSEVRSQKSECRSPA